jgi:hypothetical protein
MLDDGVGLDFAVLDDANSFKQGVANVDQRDQDQAHRVGREIGIHPLTNSPAEELLQLIREHNFDLLIVPSPDEPAGQAGQDAQAWIDTLVQRAPCPVFLAARQRAAQSVEE